MPEPIKRIEVEAEFIGGSRKSLTLPVETTPAAIVAAVEGAMPHRRSAFLASARAGDGSASHPTLMHDTVCVVFKGRTLDPTDKTQVVRLAKEDVLLVAPSRRPPPSATTPTMPSPSNAVSSSSSAASAAGGNLPTAGAPRAGMPLRPGARRVIRNGRIVNLVGGEEDEVDDEDAAAELPPEAAAWESWIVEQMRRKRGRCYCPEALTDLVVVLRPRRLAFLLLFLLGCKVSSRLDLGPPFILLSVIAAIFCNLGKRRAGELSAYSIFNPSVRRLPGQIDAQQIDEQLRRGMQI